MIENNIVSNFELDDFLFPKTCNFLGVFSCDTLPSIKNIKKNNYPHFTLICNLSKASENGTHFVCIFVHENNLVIFFDSFGRSPKINKFILSFVNNFNTNNIVYNTNIIQHPLSTACGYFCIFFVLYYDRFDCVYCFPIQLPLKFSLHNLSQNDEKCKFMIQYLTERTKCCKCKKNKKKRLN